MKLTPAQCRYLSFMDTRRASVGEGSIKPQHIAMLRRMETSGLVARSLGGNWSITDAGRTALSQNGGGK